jgi:uncharacterized membrane protein (DUF373 family)
VRLGIARQFTRVEDVVYVSLGVLLTGCAAVLLAAAGAEFWTNLVAGTLPGQVIDILDRILLVLMVVEILYTVQVSFRGQTLVPEPFLIIGLIAGIRRVLILTAEFKNLLQKGDTSQCNDRARPSGFPDHRSGHLDCLSAQDRTGRRPLVVSISAESRRASRPAER